MKKVISIIVLIAGVLLIIGGFMLNKKPVEQESPSPKVEFSNYTKKDGQESKVTSAYYYKTKEMDRRISVFKKEDAKLIYISYGQDILSEISYDYQLTTGEVYQIQDLINIEMLNKQEGMYLFVTAQLNNCKENTNCKPYNIGIISKYDKSLELIWEKKTEEFYVKDVEIKEDDKILLLAESNNSTPSFVIMDKDGNFSQTPISNPEISTIDSSLYQDGKFYIESNREKAIYLYDVNLEFLSKISPYSKNIIAYDINTTNLYKLTKDFYLEKYDLEENLLKKTLLDVEYYYEIAPDQINLQIINDKILINWLKDGKFFYLTYDLNTKKVLEKSYLENESLKEIAISSIYFDSNKIVFPKEREFVQITIQ